METIFSFMLVFFLGSFSAYMDLTGFFRQQGLNVATLLKHGPSIIFLVGNGAIGLALLMWALSAEDAAINTVLPSTNIVMKGLAIGLSVPILIRSKWFTVGSSERSSVGLVAMYEWIRVDVLHRLRQYSIHEKDRVTTKLVERLSGKEELLEEIFKRVREEAIPFNTSSQLQELDKEFKNIQHDYKDEKGSHRHIAEIISWAIEKTNLRYVSRCVDGLIG